MAGYGRLYLEQARCLAETPSRKSHELQQHDRTILKARCKELGARLLTPQQIQRLYPGGVAANVQNFYPRKSAIGMFPFEDDEDEAYS